MKTFALSTGLACVVGAVFVCSPSHAATQGHDALKNYPLHPSHQRATPLPDTEPMMFRMQNGRPSFYRISKEQCFSAKPDGHPIKCSDVPFLYRLADAIVLGSGPIPDTDIPKAGAVVSDGIGVARIPEGCPLGGALAIALGGSSDCKVPAPTGCGVLAQLAWALGGVGNGCGLGGEEQPPAVPLPAPILALITAILSLPGLRWLGRARAMSFSHQRVEAGFTRGPGGTGGIKRPLARLFCWSMPS